MEQFSKVCLGIHIFSGFASLILFWIPLLVKKGGNVHRKVGKLYVFLMWIVVFTSIYLSIENFLQGIYEFAIFLSFIALITTNPLWYGIAILKHKKGIPTSYQYQHMLFNGLIVISGLSMVIYGIYLGGKGFSTLMLIFGTLGILSGKDIIQMYQNPTSKSNWILEHIEGMLITGIAAHTAFAVFGGANFFQSIFSGYWMILPWTLPGIVGGFLIHFYKKRYKAKTKTA